MPLTGRLKSTAQSLTNDFGHNAEGMLSDAILIWSKSDLQQNRNFTDLTQAVESKLKSLQETDRCQKLQWKSAEVASGKDAAVMRLDLHVKGNIGHRNPCLYKIREYVQEVDGFGNLNVAMAGPHSVVDASYEQCDSETLFHLTLSTPLLVMLLILGVGTLPRAITPCLCLLASVPASRSVIVLIKHLWPELNMVGPDTQILFVQLALAFDYALFFWVRFSQERRSRASADVGLLLMKTLQTSGFVILLSTSILVITFLGASCYPDLNKLGYLYATLNLAFGSFFVGLYSIAVPPVLASIFPSTFDEPNSTFWDWMQHGSKMVQTGFFRPVAEVVTGKPWNYVLPVLVLAGFSPLILQIWQFRANFDVTLTDFSRSVSEYDAYHMLRDKFDDRELRQMTLLMTSTKLLTNSSEVSHAGDWTRSAAFQQAACQVVRTILKDDACQSVNVTSHNVLGYWWDSITGSCAHNPTWKETFISDDKASQRMFMFSDIEDQQGHAAQKLIHHFWDVIEPNVMIQNGRGETLFSLKLYTPVAEDMLLEAQYRQAAPWILGITLGIVCLMVATLFQSTFVGVKMVRAPVKEKSIGLV